MRRLLIFAAFAAFAAATGAAFAERLEPLPAEEAFRFDARMDGGEVVVTYDMPDGIYLYRDKFRLTTATPGFQLGETILPPGTAHDDEFFGRTTVYYGSLRARAAVVGEGDFQIVALSQGCDEQIGICYPPMENIAALSATGGNGVVAASGAGKDEASALAAGIQDNSLLWTIAAFFLLGVGLSLTPCVLPMLPVLLGVIGGGEKSRRRVIGLTASYIAGVVIAFTALGVAAGAGGQLLTAFLQQPAVLVAVAALFVALAFSMFGAYELQAPAIVRNKLATVGGKSGAVGALLIGALSAVVVSPCVAAPLVGALLYIAQTGDMLVGGLALMSLSLGMSVLLAAAGIAGAAALPRAGEWMSGVKRLFGALLLALAVWVTSPLLPAPAQMLAYGALLLFVGVSARPFAPAEGAIGAGAKAAALAAILWGAMMLAGVALGGRDVLTPLSPLAGGAGASAAGAAPLAFQPAQTPAELDRALAATTRPVMLEFFADWCVSCKEMERFTFADPRVWERLQNLSLIRADVTANVAPERALLKRYGLFGPPALLFFSADGELIEGVRVVGYQDADEFLQTLAAAGL